MAFQYAKLGLAALLAAPAVAAPVAQNVVTITQQAQSVQTQMVYVDQNGKVVQGPAQGGNAPAAPQPAPSSSAAAVSIQNVQPTKAQSSQQQSAAAPKSSQAAASSAAAPKSSTTAAPSSGSGTKTGGSKKGLVYTKNTAALAQATQIASSSKGAITWMYDWEGYPFINGQGSNGVDVNGIEFVPMLHSKDSMFTEAWKGGSPSPQGKGAKNVLFLNEPDNSQFACDPQTAASLYTSTFVPGAQGARLGGPATTGSTGWTWLPQFLQACSSCHFDFHTYHYYSETTDLQPMKDAIEKIYKIGGNKPLWITEFGLKAQRDGGNFDANTRAKFIEAASQWMDTVDYIERYAPYQVSTDGSADSITTSSPITNMYISA